MASRPSSEINTLSVYASFLQEIKQKFTAYPSFKELWVLDIANEFVKEYEKDEFVKVYAAGDEEIRTMAIVAARNFISKLINNNIEIFIEEKK